MKITRQNPTFLTLNKRKDRQSFICHEKQLTSLINLLILLPELNFVNFNAQMGLNFIRFSLNSGEKMRFARICSIFLQI